MKHPINDDLKIWNKENKIKWKCFTYKLDITNMYTIIRLKKI